MLGRRGTSSDLNLIFTGSTASCCIECRDVHRKLPWTPHPAPRCWACGLGVTYTSSSKLFDTTLYLSKPFAMTTDLLMDNSHAPYRSESLPQAASSTKLGTLSAQPQNAPDARLTLDETVDRILVKANSQLGEGEARVIVEALEKVCRKCFPKPFIGAPNSWGQMLDPKYSMSLRTRRRCLRGLVQICGEHGTLPSSYVLPESRLQRLGYCPISSGGFSKVWPGAYKEDDGGEGDDKSRDVAIKVIRYYGSDDVQGLKKVR
jgi:hypothetical protein